MLAALLRRRWSTLTLLGVSAGLSALVYLASRTTAPKPTANASVVCLPAPPAAKTSAFSDSDLTGKIPANTAKSDAVAARWQHWSAAPRTPENEREMAAFLTELATRDHERALALALAEGNLRLREILCNAVLRGWAACSPDDASSWALT